MGLSFSFAESFYDALKFIQPVSYLICSYIPSYSRFKDFLTHERSVHLKLKSPMERVVLNINYSDDLKYECLVCKERFRQKRLLNDHLRFDHDEYRHKVIMVWNCSK